MSTRMLCILVTALLVLTGCDQASLLESEPQGLQDTPFSVVPDGASKSSVEGQYIVVFKETAVGFAQVDGLAAELVSAQGGQLVETYQHALKGFTARLPDQAIDALKKNPNVAYIEPDQVVYALDTQTGATWGLDRIDQRPLPLDGSYTYDGSNGVTVYIIDTGLDHDHPGFEGRASFGFDALGGNGEDCNGHGTHVGGTVGSATYGVAKDVNLVSVRVLNCSGSGTYSGVIAGIDWVTANHTGSAVANMSLGGGFSSAVNNAVENSIAAGVTYAISAGNSNANACNQSPASAPSALTVGSTTSSDARSSFSNYGVCVDIFAPGSGITSLWRNGGTNTISGTSMASPHVAGAAALYLAANPGSTPAQVGSALTGNATTGAVSNPGSGSPNLLLYTIFSSGPPPANNPPTAAFSFSTSELTASFSDQSSDIDGTVVSRAWNFGDGNSSAQQNPSHTYGAAGTYTVTLTVTDDGGASDTATEQVTVTDPPTSSIVLVLHKTSERKGQKQADLRWSGASTSKVDIYLEGNYVQQTKNDGRHTVKFNLPGNGPFSLQVCEQNSNVCSNEVFASY